MNSKSQGCLRLGWSGRKSNVVTCCLDCLGMGLLGIAELRRENLTDLERILRIL